MATSKFFVYGPEVGASDTYITATLSGIGYDGSVQLSYGSDQSTTISHEEFVELRERDLIISDTQASKVGSNVINAIDKVDAAIANTTENDVLNHLNTSREELFRAAVKSTDQ